MLNIPLKTVADVDSIAQGHVFSGTEGLKNGLVDKIGTLDDAIQAAKKAAGIKDKDPITVVEYPKLGFNFRVFGDAMSPYALFGWGKRDNKAAEGELDFMNNPEWVYLRALVDNPGKPLYMLPPEYNVQDAKWGRNVSE